MGPAHVFNPPHPGLPSLYDMARERQIDMVIRSMIWRPGEMRAVAEGRARFHMPNFRRAWARRFDWPVTRNGDGSLRPGAWEHGL